MNLDKVVERFARGIVGVLVLALVGTAVFTLVINPPIIAISLFALVIFTYLIGGLVERIINRKGPDE
jgi:CDP-diglyceride synthetase